MTWVFGALNYTTPINRINGKNIPYCGAAPGVDEGPLENGASLIKWENRNMFYALRTPAPQNVTSMRLHAIWTYRKHQLVAAMHVGTVVCLAAMLWALWWANHSISVM